MPTMSKQGQITIPKKIRDEMGYESGTELEFQVKGDCVQIRKSDQPRRAMDRWRGALDLGTTVDEFVDDLRGSR